jgi:uncharacterized membrane protein YgcG
MVLPPQRRARPPLLHRQDAPGEGPSSYHGVSPPQHEARLDLLVAALKKLADRGLTAGCVLANLHHLWVVPLMERPLRVFEMTEVADPVALARSRLLQDPFPWAFAATQAQRAVDLRPGRCGDDVLWAFEMLPTGPLVSGVLDLISCLAGFSSCRRILRLRLTPANGERERREVRPAPVPRARARRNNESGSGWSAGASVTRGTGSAASGGARSSGCASSRGSPRQGQRSTRHRTRRRRKRRKRSGSRFSLIGGSLLPRHRSRLRWQ